MESKANSVTKMIPIKKVGLSTPSNTIFVKVIVNGITNITYPTIGKSYYQIETPEPQTRV